MLVRVIGLAVSALVIGVRGYTWISTNPVLGLSALNLVINLFLGCFVCTLCTNALLTVLIGQLVSYLLFSELSTTYHPHIYSGQDLVDQSNPICR